MYPSQLCQLYLSYIYKPRCSHLVKEVENIYENTSEDFNIRLLFLICALILKCQKRMSASKSCALTEITENYETHSALV